jgi:hypothetical protein
MLFYMRCKRIYFDFNCLYSYRSASIGFNLLALTAGYKPAARPTSEQTMIPPPVFSIATP